MRIFQFLLSALCASVIAVMAATSGYAQEGPKPSGPRLLGTAPQEFLLTKIIVSDIVKSYEFYTKIIGLKLAAASNRPAPTPPTSSTVGEVGMSFSGTQADAFFLIVKSRTENQTPDSANMTTIGFKVPDAPAVIRRGKEAGVSSHQGSACHEARGDFGWLPARPRRLSSRDPPGGQLSGQEALRPTASASASLKSNTRFDRGKGRPASAKASTSSWTRR